MRGALEGRPLLDLSSHLPGRYGTMLPAGTGTASIQIERSGRSEERAAAAPSPRPPSTAYAMDGPRHASQW
jgi:crotonobetainyl-CoA:carnitine CoA-transferase CaiB-like acyl-CoA transferase